jgi:hypothetical protein
MYGGASTIAKTSVTIDAPAVSGRLALSVTHPCLTQVFSSTVSALHVEHKYLAKKIS